MEWRAQGGGGGGVCSARALPAQHPPSHFQLLSLHVKRTLATMTRNQKPSAELTREEVFEAVFDGMANGKTVADVARELGLKPGTVRKWLGEDEETYKRYQRMRPLLGAAFAEEAVEVARNTTNAASAADRLLVETLKWAAAKSAPAEYGEKQVLEHQGQQTLQVKVVEEDAPVKNVQALQAGMVMGVLHAGLETPADLS